MRLRTRSGYVFAACLAAFLAACGDGSNGPSAAEDYFPVATGNEWEFDLSGTGTVDTFDVEISGSMEIGVGDTVQLDIGLTAFEVTSEVIQILDVEQGMWSDTTIEIDTFFWHVAGGQIGQYETLDDSTARLIHSPPIEPGRIWFPGPDEPNGSYEVISVDGTVTVPYGTFEDCAHIFHDNPDSLSESDDFHAPGIGPVLIQVHVDVDSIVWDADYSLTWTSLQR